MSPKPLIAACLPSYGEEETIASVAGHVAAGLGRLSRRARVLIVHVDCGSPDRTVERFAALDLPVPAVQRTAPRGKGNALRVFFELCRELGARYALAFDTDLTGIDASWVSAFADPLLDGTAAAVLPAYPRGAYEASATHHLAVPIVYGVSGRLIPQPIGGEFGLDLEAVDPGGVDWTGSTREYGVDIALTFAALRGTGPVALADPGAKLHRPSFFHLPRVFRHVAEAGLRSAAAAGPDAGYAPAPEGIGPRLWGGVWQHRERTRALAAEARAQLGARDLAAPGFDDPGLPEWSAEAWPRALAAALRAPGADPAAAAAALTPLFVLRAAGFWLGVERDGPAAGEAELLRQARQVRALIPAGPPPA